MKVLLLNGSPHEHGSTREALTRVEEGLRAGGAETSVLWIGKGPMQGCIACGGCKQTHQCVFDDLVNEALTLLSESDGLVIGSPVYYASPNGSLLSFLDRLFYAGDCFYGKPAACVCAARRAGTTATLDALWKYPIGVGMPLVSSFYWPMTFGARAEETRRDEEGAQVLEQLGANMAWLVRCIELGKEVGVSIPPKAEPRMRTNFIR